MTAGDWLLVKHVFDAALNCDIEEQRSLIDELCAGRPEVREEVESLLAAHRKAGPFLDRAERFGETPSWVGRRLGSYRLVSEIGDGGMGRVFLAERDDDQFRKQVAVKIIGAGVTHPEILRRFLDERQILATLDHPNIAHLLDGGVTDDGMPYMVMEYIIGLPITAYCEQAGLSVRERLELFLTVSLAVHYAHQHLVVHRDLKPANILVTPEGTAVLLDFGIAKMLDPLTSRTQATVAQFHPVTLEYASPEQLRGGVVTTTADIYSLGVILYELLTGSRPHALADATLDQAMRIVGETAAEPPGKRCRGRGLPFSEDLDCITLKALRTEPQDRYGSAQDFAADIKRYLEGLPVQARRGSVRYVARKMLARHKIAVAAVATGLALAMVGAGAVAREAHIANRERAKALSRFNELRGLARSMIFELHDGIARLPGSTETRKKLVTIALNYLDSLAREAGDDVGLQVELASAYRRLGNVQGDPNTANLGDSAGALTSYRSGMRAAQAALRIDPLRDEALRSLGFLYLNTAEIELREGRRSEAKDKLDRALLILRQRSGRQDAGWSQRSDLATALFYLFLYHQNNDDALSRDYLTQADNLYEARLLEQPYDDDALHNVALAHRYLATFEKVDSALTYLQRSLELDRRRSAARPSDATCRLDVSMDLAEMGRQHRMRRNFGQALMCYREALEIREALAASDPKNVMARNRVAYMHFSIGDARFEMGDMTGAVESMRKSIAIYEEFAGGIASSGHANYFLRKGYRIIGQAKARLGRAQAACDAYRSGDAIRPDPGEPIPKDWPDLSRALASCTNEAHLP